MFGGEAETELVAYNDKDWSKVDYNGGCPAGIMQPGCFSYFYHALREPFGRYASKFVFNLSSVVSGISCFRKDKLAAQLAI